MDQEQTELRQELIALRREIEKLNAHRFVRRMNSPAWLVFETFLRGMILGLGTVVGATILVSIIGYLMNEIDFIPILGEWAARIAEEMRMRN